MPIKLPCDQVVIDGHLSEVLRGLRPRSVTHFKAFCPAVVGFYRWVLRRGGGIVGTLLCRPAGGLVPPRAAATGR